MKMVAQIKTRQELNSFAEVGISSCPIISRCKVGPEMWDGESLIRSIPPPTAVCTLVNPDLEDIMHLYYVFVFRSISLSSEIGANEIPKWSIYPPFPSSKSGFRRYLEFVIWNCIFCIKYHEQYEQSDGCVLLTEVVQDGSPRKLVRRGDGIYILGVALAACSCQIVRLIRGLETERSICLLLTHFS